MNSISINLSGSGEVENAPIKRRKGMFACPKCNHLCRSGLELESHLHSVHAKSMNYTLHLKSDQLSSVANSSNSSGILYTGASFSIPKSILKYNCLECARCYISPMDLELHLRLHEPYKCIICPKTFRTMYHLREHIVLVHDDNYRTSRGWCPICSFPACKEALAQHMVGHVKIVRFNCRICRKAPSTRRLFWKHIYTDHKDLAPSNIIERLQCTCCGKIFRTENGLMRHKSRKQNRGKHYRCNFCHQIFRREETIQNHINLVHSKKTEIRQCQFCGDKIPSYNIEHHFKSHTNKWFCDSCDLQCDQSCDVVKASAETETTTENDPMTRQAVFEPQVLENGQNLIPQDNVTEFIVNTDGAIMANQNDGTDYTKRFYVCAPGTTERNFDISIEDLYLKEIVLKEYII